MENNGEIREPIQLFGIECGEGWLPLIKEAQQIIDDWNAKHKDGIDTWGGYKLEFVQVKEKWGELCLYLNSYPDEIYDKIRELEEKSLCICEQCGTTENVTREWTHNWIMTLCPECRKKEMERWNAMFNKINKNIQENKNE